MMVMMARTSSKASRKQQMRNNNNTQMTMTTTTMTSTSMSSTKFKKRRRQINRQRVTSSHTITINLRRARDQKSAAKVAYLAFAMEKTAEPILMIDKMVLGVPWTTTMMILMRTRSSTLQSKSSSRSPSRSSSRRDARFGKCSKDKSSRQRSRVSLSSFYLQWASSMVSRSSE